MRGGIRRPKNDAGDGAGVFIGENHACVGFAVDLIAIAIHRHFLAPNHSPVVELKIGAARKCENVLKKSAGVDAGADPVTRRGCIDELDRNRF